jgi:hypothetical protein
MIRGYRDKEFRDHLTGQEAVDVKEYDEWKEDLEYSRQFMKDAEEARHDPEKEETKLAIELSD